MAYFIWGWLAGLIAGFALCLIVSCVGSINKENEAFEDGYIVGYEKGKKENKNEI